MALGQEAVSATAAAPGWDPATEPALAPVRTQTWVAGPIDPAAASPRPAPFISRNPNTRMKPAKRSFKVQLCCGSELGRMATLVKLMSFGPWGWGLTRKPSKPLAPCAFNPGATTGLRQPRR